MRIRTAGVTVALSALALSAVACGPDPQLGAGGGAETTGSQEPASTSTPSSTTPPPLGVIDIDPDGLGLVALPGPDGGVDPDLMIGCNGEMAFPLSSVDRIAPIGDEDSEGYLEAIEPFLSGEEGQYWPQEGWNLLWAGDENAYLIARTDNGTLAWMYLEKDADRWKWAGSSLAGDPCVLRVGTPAEFNTVNWYLDPAFSEPTQESTELHLLINERECVSGQEIGDRLRGPQVVLTADQVRIVFVAERPPGDAFECPGNPETPYVVELPEPLGDRSLMDGFDVGITLDDYVG